MIVNKSTKKRVKIVECKQHNQKVVLTNFNWMVTTQKFSYKIKSWKYDSLTPYGISNFNSWRFDGPGWKINSEVDDSRRLNTSLRASSVARSHATAARARKETRLRIAGFLFCFSLRSPQMESLRAGQFTTRRRSVLLANLSFSGSFRPSSLSPKIYNLVLFSLLSTSGCINIELLVARAVDNKL